MLMFLYSIYTRANLVTKSYDGCAKRVVFSRLQNCADFSDGDFRDGGSGCFIGLAFTLSLKLSFFLQ